MRWKKLGRIFDPTSVDLPDGCVEFAQAPQALVFDDFVRIYFSTRAFDAEGGKSRSHIAFVDMDRALARRHRACHATPSSRWATWLLSTSTASSR